MRCEPRLQEILEPSANGFDLVRFRGKNTDDWRGSIKDRNCVGSIIDIAVGISHLGSEQTVGLHADLMRRPVIHTQGSGAPANIDPERFPRERLLKDALTEVAGKE